ncbi:MAG TPA: methionine--tRNA ligase, partial [Myxococcota bacterium]|nr:methionine--tRNA ligase [Myxococcota bacterium]
MSRTFYVTTPIYYVNDVPHLGTAYTTIAADVFARYHRARGDEVRFLTGTDEHGQKIEETAKARGETPQALSDRVVERFRAAWQRLDVRFDDFIRTTEARHESVVVEMWKQIAARGDIYLGEYEDWYCVADEAYFTEGQLVNGRCPSCGREVKKLKEPSYFFRLSKYREPLLRFYEAHPDFVLPATRYNEVKRFVEGEVRDLSVSRSTFKWGIPVPGDPAHVMYVWFDALFNYVSALGGPADERYRRFWPAAVHLVGKDILRFHAVFWPAFLLAAEIPPPRHVVAHGWWTVNGQKMSKSLGNTVEPGALADEFGLDAVRYFLLREVTFGLDGDFRHAALIGRINSDLANDLGNLVSRTIAMAFKYRDGMVPAPGAYEDGDRRVVDAAAAAAADAARLLDAFLPSRALEAIWTLVAAANKYVDDAAPWALDKEGKTARLDTVLYVLLEAVRQAGLMVAPFMPSTGAEIARRLGVEGAAAAGWPGEWGALPSGGRLAQGPSLFPRIDADREKALLAKWTVVTPAAPASDAVEAPGAAAAVAVPVQAAAPAPAPAPAAAVAAVEIPYDDFAKVDLRVARVLSAEPVKKSQKLLRLMVDVG